MTILEHNIIKSLLGGGDAQSLDETLAYGVVGDFCIDHDLEFNVIYNVLQLLKFC